MRILPAIVLSVVAVAQTPTSDQAAVVLQNAVSAQFGNNAIKDVELSGTVITHFGKDQSGTVTLQADSTGKSKVTLNTDAGQRTEYSSGPLDDPACTWTDASGATHNIPPHNCWASSVWFMPLVSMPAAQQSASLSSMYAGKETKDGTSVQHLSVNIAATGQKTAATEMIQALSKQELYLDTTTALPSSLTFSAHLDNDSKTNIPVEVLYSDYRDVNGIKIPFHIEKRLNGGSLLEITIESATFNTGTEVK